MNISDTASTNALSSALKRIERTEMCWGRNHPKMVKDLRNLSDLLFVLGDYVKAKPIYWRILDIQQLQGGVLNPDSAETLMSLGEVHEAEDDTAVAEQFYRAALGVLDKNSIDNSELEFRILLKLYGVYKMFNVPEKILEIENRTYVFLNKFKHDRASTPANSTSPSGDHSQDRARVQKEKSLCTAA